MTNVYQAVTAIAAFVLCCDAALADTIEKRCAGWALVTAGIATAHQHEVPLATMLERIHNIERADNLDPASAALVRRIIVSIYKEPRFATVEYQQSFINKARDEVHVGCLDEALRTGALE